MKVVDKANMTEREKGIVGELSYQSVVVRRGSDREFDLNLEGTKKDGMGFGAWLPLAIIAQSDWPKLAAYSDYPEMVAVTAEWPDPDWSGIRDSSEEKIWDMFARVRA